MNSISRILLAGFLVISVKTFAEADNRDHAHVGGAQLAKSELVQNIASALKLFEGEFQDRYQKALSDEFVGFTSKSNDGEAEVAMIYIVGENRVQEDAYHCHVDLENDGSKEFHCEYEESSSEYAYTPQAKTYSVDEFVESLNELIVELEKNKFDPAALVGIKAWQNRRGLWMTLTLKDMDKVYVRCHYHGEGIDCHQSANPGKDEPLR